MSKHGKYKKHYCKEWESQKKRFLQYGLIDWLEENKDTCNCSHYRSYRYQTYCSLIVDESTDLSVYKYLAFCIQNFSKKRQQIITDFLGCISLTEASAKDLYSKATIEYLATIKLDVKNMVGFGSNVKKFSKNSGENFHLLIDHLNSVIQSFQIQYNSGPNEKAY
ncbi:hypothetical protein G5I_14411 [Acromyrmex echinatior]|uniref:DUF4371 domain-containing protein n=1 Tax=Acromyrmex echinatior TaxID=103372 RepID=F4X7M7_ACREC|nr:hypothetical protein G5I_14411 [Acromyrmex echinatior]